MPELPEVETTRKGLEPLITDRKIKSVHIYKKNLRWEIPSHLKSTLKDQQIKKISRLAKYLLGAIQPSSLATSLLKSLHASVRYWGNKESKKESSPWRKPSTGIFSSRFNTFPMAASMIVERRMTSGVPCDLNQSTTLFTSLTKGPSSPRKVDRVISPKSLLEVIPLRAAAFFNNHLLSKALSIHAGVFRKSENLCCR